MPKIFIGFFSLQTNMTLPNFDNMCVFYIRRNLPTIMKSEEFMSIPSEVFFRVLDDPVVLCHENLIWLDAIETWSKGCDKLFETAMKHIPLQYVSKNDLNTLGTDQRLERLGALKAKVVEISQRNTGHLENGVKYFPKKSFDLVHMDKNSFLSDEFSPGLIVHFKNNQEVVLQDIEISLESLKPLAKKSVRDFCRASQVLYKNQLYFIFDNHCMKNNHHEHWNQPIFKFCLVEKIWSKVDCPLSFIVPQVGTQCTCQVVWF